MKHIIILISIALISFGYTSASDNDAGISNRINIGAFNAIKFPSNGDIPTDSIFAFKYDNPERNGLPIWGANKQGTSFIWEYYPIQQKGYYVTFWWANNGSFVWQNGKSNSYYGCHPYPVGGPPGGQTLAHNWEIAGLETGKDNVKTLTGNPFLVEKGRWFTQAFRVVVNEDGSKTGRFYIDLPDTSENKIIEYTAKKDWGEDLPPSPAVIFGDAPWGGDYYGTERLSGLLGRVKIFNKSLSIKDLKSEAMDMSRLVTMDGKNKIWWGKTFFKSIEDLQCDYGTARTFNWMSDRHKGKLVKVQDKLIGKEVVFDPVYEKESRKVQITLFNSSIDTECLNIDLLEGSNFSFKIAQAPITIGPSDSVQLTLSFSPDSAAEFSDVLLVKDSQHQDLYKIFLRGIGLSASDKTQLPVEGNGTFSLKYFNKTTPTFLKTINYVLTEPRKVVLTVFDLSGRKIKNLVNKASDAGHYSVRWDGTNDQNISVRPGVYFIALSRGIEADVFKTAFIH